MTQPLHSRVVIALSAQEKGINKALYPSTGHTMKCVVQVLGLDYRKSLKKTSKKKIKKIKKIVHAKQKTYLTNSAKNLV